MPREKSRNSRSKRPKGAKKRKRKVSGQLHTFESLLKVHEQIASTGEFRFGTADVTANTDYTVVLLAGDGKEEFEATAVLKEDGSLWMNPGMSTDDFGKVLGRLSVKLAESERKLKNNG